MKGMSIIMKTEWSLDILYKGYEDPNFINDIDKLTKLSREMDDLSQTLFEQNKEYESNLLTCIKYLEEYEVLASKLLYYVTLKQSTNTSDNDTVNFMNRINRIMSNTIKSETVIKKFISRIPNLLEIIKTNKKLNEYYFLFLEMKEDSKYLLNDEVEEVIAKLNLSSGFAWNRMQENLTSNLLVPFKENIITLPEVRNLAYSDDATTRKEAYEAELSSYDQIKDAISFSLNNIKLQVNTICNLRGYKSPLEMTLKQSRMKKETLDAMLTAMKEFMPKFHTYLKRKAKLLGHSNGLPWYDLFAPLGTNKSTFTIEETKDYLISHFQTFSDDMADLIKEAFENEWIDFYPKKGKVGGAFCENLPFVKQSRILMNFDGSLNSVVTLAHELGHAYHGKMIEEHLPLNTDYSMPVAETASIFNETIIMNAAIEEATKEEKIALIESVLQDTTQIMCDIYSRFLFESAVFEKGKNEFLFAKDLKDMMCEAQKEAYGDGLDPEYLHPYMWICKGHYYSDELSFYNFPYAFGGLFARGLYEKYKTEGKDFVPKYKELLKMTTVKTVEDVAKICDIDLTDPEFFKQGLLSYSNLIDEFLLLTQ